MKQLNYRISNSSNKQRTLVDLFLKIRPVYQVLTTMIFFMVLTISTALSQGNEQAFINLTTVGYTDCTGVTTVRFPVRENYSICGQADNLRHIKVYDLNITNGIASIYAISKDYIVNGPCDNPDDGQFTISNCRTYDKCKFGGTVSCTIENGVGDQRFVVLTIPDLANDAFGKKLKFNLVGWYDYECCEGTTAPNSTQGYGFDFIVESASISATIDNKTPTISQVTSSDCNTAMVSWNDQTDPASGCTNWTTEVWRAVQGSGSFIKVGEKKFSPFHDNNPTYAMSPGTAYEYKLRPRWNVSFYRTDTGVFSGTRSVTIPQPNGMISGTVKSTGGVPINGVTITATRQSYDQTSACSYLNTPSTLTTTTSGNGTFSFTNIYYGHPNDDATTYKISGTYNSDVITMETVSLDNGTPSVTADLIDQTSYTASGEVYTLTAGCGVENTIVTAKGLSPTNLGMVAPYTTSANGNFTLALPGPDNYRFYSTYTTPSGIQKDSVDRNITATNTPGVFIPYTKTNVVSGFVGGDCAAIFGSATIEARTASGCLITNTTSNSSTGLYQMTLPSIPLKINVINYNPTSGPLVGTGPLSQTHNVVLDGNTTLDFIFRSPISIEVVGLPAQICSDIAYPIMEQFKPYPVSYLVTEGTGCLVDTGYVIIVDEIGGVEGTPAVRDTIPISNGIALDTIIPRLPNIFADYSKPIEWQAFAGPDLPTAIASSVKTERAIVVGSAPRGQQFTTVSPQIPRLIIRDPPGDASYSFIEQGQSFSTSSSMYTQDAEGGNFWVKAKAGVEIALISLEAGIEIGAKFAGEAVHANSEETLYEFATTERYSTSDDPNIAGKEGDVYVGAAINLTYANSDIISLDLAGCRINKRVELVINPETFETEFVYAESDITNVIIPSLQNIVNDMMQTEANRHRAAEGIEIWNQVIAMNEELKEEAFSGQVTLNQSFGGTAGPLDKTFTETTTKTRTIEWKQLIEESIALEAGFSLAGSGLSAGYEINLKQEFGGSTTNGTTTTTTTGFTFDDDDINDLFTIDWAIDPVFGTPVFRAAGNGGQQAGNTSCPWELGAKRDKPVFSVPIKSKTAGTGVNSINFSFELGNGSETAETRDYTLQLVSNPNGAEVNILGITQQLWNFPNLTPGTQTYNVIVSRNPNNENFHFEGLQFRFYPSCDAGQADDPIGEAVYQSISAYFASPCSQIAMSTPTVNNGFVINAASNNMMNIGINGYDYNTTINIVSMEYSPVGANTWTNSNIVLAKTDLVNNNPPATTKTWVTTGIADGTYDIRLKLSCPSGGNTTSTYSERVTGVIDRKAPVVFGIPEPIDDDYASGDEVSVTFNELIDCNGATVDLKIQPGNIPVPSTFACVGKKLVVTPGSDLSTMPGKSFQVVVTGLKDTHGNTRDPYTWEFTVGEIDGDGDGYVDNATRCIGSALEFDGVNDHLQIPHQANLNIVDADGFTFETWVNTAGNGPQSIISKSLNYIVEVHPEGGSVGLYLSGEWQYVTGTLPLNKWAHLAISFDRVTKVASFYIDGSLSGTKTFASSPFSNADDQPLIIGNQTNGPSNLNYFSGRLDDLAIWDRPLTQTEIMATMAARLTGTETDLLAYYNFNDAPSCVTNTGMTTLTDAANSNDATLINFGLTGCLSNFGSERNTDSDLDGIPDGCDVLEACFGMPGSADSDGDGFLECADLCPGSADMSMDFDGINDQIVVPHHASQNVANSDFTFSAWVSPSDKVYNTILSKGAGGAGTNYIFQIQNRKISLYLTDASRGQWTYSYADVPENQWSHVAASYSVATDKVSFYLNGKLTGERQDSLGVHNNTDGNSLYIGRQGYACNCNFFDGRMDDVTVWNRGLSKFEIQAIMAAPLQGNETGLAAYYDFNESPACGISNTAIPIVDKSPNAQNGTLTNFTFSSCNSNWVSGRNLDSDNDNIGDPCDVLYLCPPNFANAGKLIGNQTTTQAFATDGLLQSQQVILSPAQVTYSSLISSELLPGFEVGSGALLQILLGGCNQ